MTLKEDNETYYAANLSISPAIGLVKTDTSELRLGPVNMKVLVTLLERPGKLVSRAQLFESVWKYQEISDDVLTRCISDLRSQFSKFTELQVIETIPKRGYRWLPDVSVSPPRLVSEKAEIGDKKLVEEGRKEITNSIFSRIARKSQLSWWNYLKMTIVLALSLLTISTSSLWLVDNLLQPKLTRVALIPIQITEKIDPDFIMEFEEVLQTHLINSKGIRFLSRSAVASRPKNPFPYLSREFGTQWVIEGRVRKVNDKYRINLNLVDARTAIVSLSFTQDINYQTTDLKNFSLSFIKNLNNSLYLSVQEQDKSPSY